MRSVNKAWAVLRGRLTGDEDEALELLKKMNPRERALRNKLEQRSRVNKRKRSLKMGQTSNR